MATQEQIREKRRERRIADFENGHKPSNYRVVTFGDIVRLEREVEEWLWWFPFVKTKRWVHARFFPDASKAAEFVREEYETYWKWKEGTVVL